MIHCSRYGTVVWAVQVTPELSLLFWASAHLFELALLHFVGFDVLVTLQKMFALVSWYQTVQDDPE